MPSIASSDDTWWWAAGASEDWAEQQGQGEGRVLVRVWLGLGGSLQLEPDTCSVNSFVMMQGMKLSGSTGPDVHHAS